MSGETILECCAIAEEITLASAWPLRCTKDRLAPGLQELRLTVDAFVQDIEGLVRSAQLNAGDRVEPGDAQGLSTGVMGSVAVAGLEVGEVPCLIVDDGP